MRRSRIQPLLDIVKELLKEPDNKEVIGKVKQEIKTIEEDLDNNYHITSVSKEDIKQAYLDQDDRLPADVEKVIDELSESEMEWLASKLADDYCNQLFWSSLRIIFEDRILAEKRSEKNAQTD